MDKNHRFIYLFERFAAKKYSEAEKEELFSMVSSTDYDSILQQLVGDQWNLTIPEWVRENDDQKAADVFEQIMTRVKVKKLTPDNEAPQTIGIGGRRKFWRNIAAAAAVIVLGASTYFMYFNEPDKHTIVATTPAQQYKNDVAPGGNKAILTLTDGSQIVLDSAANGALSQQGTTKIIKLDDGHLAYTATGVKDPVMYNTITTPKGGQYQIVLSDGSKVWLNAASSLRFPTSFPGKERNVELTGEGYFEIAKHANQPFHVKVNNMEVEVLGTHFNVNAYKNENEIKTSVLEGKVYVSQGHQAVTLSPGQQSKLNIANNNLQKISNINLEDIVAWKNGAFQFSSADIKSILRQAERWYDVSIVYDSQINETFSGGMPRSENISQLLEILESTGKVNFKINEKQIIVSKNN